MVVDTLGNNTPLKLMSLRALPLVELADVIDTK